MIKWEHIGYGQFKARFYAIDVIYNLYTEQVIVKYSSELDIEMVKYIQERMLPLEQEKAGMRKQLFQEQLCAVLSDEKAPTRSVSDELDKIKDNPKVVGDSAIRRIYNRVKDFLLFS